MRKETESRQLKKVKTSTLIMAYPFESLFSIDTEAYKQTYSKVYVNMDLLGFDETQPIIVWKDRNIVIDGHTRLRVALEKEIKEVWVIEKDFLNEEDAIQYAVHLQRDRRKLTDGDIFRLVRLLDWRRPPGRPPKTASTDAVSNPLRTSKIDKYHIGLMKVEDINNDENTASRLPKTPYPKDGAPETALNLAINDRISSLEDDTKVEGVDSKPPARGSSKLDFKGDLREGLILFKEWAYGRSADITATLIGTSRAKVDKCRNILRSKNVHIMDKVRTGKLTINRASSIVKNNGERRNDPKLKFQKGIVVHSKDQSIDSIDLDSVKWVILGTHGKPPKINDPIPKDSIISPKE